MPLILWDNDQFSTRISIIDEQHKRLVEMINALHEAMLNRKGTPAIQDVLAQAIDYTVYHFGTEEKLMEEHHYPGLEKHRTQHNKFKEKVLEFKNNLSTTPTVTLEFSHFLRGWLLEHIMVSDKDLGIFLNHKGLS